MGNVAGYRWGIYERISEDNREGAGLGVKRQEADNREHVARADPDGAVVDSYADNDISAYSGKPRPEYDRMIADIRSGRINAVCAWHNDRLHRSPRELEDFIELIQKHGTRVITVRAGEWDLATPTGRFIARQLGIVARLESEHKADRIQRKQAELAANGAPPGGGHRPYGFTRVFDRPERPHRIIRIEIEPDEAEVIREMAKRFLSGEGLRTIARDLNQRGIPTSTGCQWSTTTVARILASARIAGMREHQPRPRGSTKRIRIAEITNQQAWPAIISAAQSDRIRGILSRKSRRTSPGSTGRYLCSGGVLHCSCGRPMGGHARGSGKPPLYFCDGDPGRDGCGHCYIDAGGTDQVVAGWVAAALAGPAFREALARLEDGQPDDAVLLDDIARATEQMEQLAVDSAEERITRAEWLAKRDALDARIKRSRRQLSRADARDVLDGLPSDEADLRAWLLDASVPVARRRAVILAVMEKVTVAPAVKGRGRFDPMRLEPVWKA